MLLLRASHHYMSISFFCCLCIVLPNGGALSTNSSPQIPHAILSRKEGLSKSYFFQDLSPNEGESDQVESKAKTKLFSKSAYHSVEQIREAFRSTFLPAGYPHKTPNGYLSYSIWSWIQDLTTQLRGVLATQRVLEGVGVGREGATALSASLNFILRDGCGMASTLLFTAAVVSRFRGDVKRWRLFADIINDVGITLEVAATLVPQRFFLPMICAGNVCKAMCGVAAGACNSAINLYWARGSDISDINAKFGAQHTVTGSLGLVFAATFARSVSATSQLTLWILYSILTVLHIAANMQCLKLIAFDHLNTCRMNVVVQDFFSKIERTENKSESIVPLDTPMKVAIREPLYFGLRSESRKVISYPIRMGVSFNTLADLSGRDKVSLTNLSYGIESDKYVISVGNMNHNKKGHCILVAFSDEADGKVKAKAYLHAMLLGKLLQNVSSADLKTENYQFVEATAAADIEHLWVAFAKSVYRAGWNLHRTELWSEGYELSLK